MDEVDLIVISWRALDCIALLQKSLTSEFDEIV
jgi:hypothetical protein